ncbi:hypothetical protein BH24GEM3_BH24GEM3_12850 [soil metagenome]
MRRFVPLGCLVVALCAAAPAAAQQPAAPVEYITADPSLPYSQVVRVGNTLYLSGMLGTVPGTGLVRGGSSPKRARRWRTSAAPWSVPAPRWTTW